MVSASVMIGGCLVLASIVQFMALSVANHGIDLDLNCVTGSQGEPLYGPQIPSEEFQTSDMCRPAN